MSNSVPQLETINIREGNATPPLAIVSTHTQSSALSRPPRVRENGNDRQKNPMRAHQLHGYGGSFPSQPTEGPPVDARITKPPSRRQSSKPLVTRGSGFTQSETDGLLDILESMLPLCREEWDAVSVKHSKNFGHQHRTVDSLKRKYASLHRKQMPTGDPLMPHDFRKAKRIRHMMTKTADVGFGDEDVDELTGIVDDENDNDVSGLETSPALMSHRVPSPEAAVDLEASGAQALQPTPPDSTPSPRPLLNKRRSSYGQKWNDNDFVAMMKMSMVQEQHRREEEGRRKDVEKRRRIEHREEDRKRREEDRRDDRLPKSLSANRREHENKMQQRLIETMLMMVSPRFNRQHSPADDSSK